MPEKLEYLIVLSVLLIFVLSAYSSEVLSLLRRREFWLSYCLFATLCTLLDLVAVRYEWWTFREKRISGLFLLSLPIEEFVLFSLIFVLAIAAWESEEE